MLFAAAHAVADDTPPVVTLQGEANVRLFIGQVFVDAGATAVDDVDGDVPVTVEGTVDTTRAGTYTLTYTATDAAGNAATATRTVAVVAARFHLVVETFGAGAVTVVDHESALACSDAGRCRAAFEQGTALTLRANAPAGWRLDEWFGCTPTSSAGECRLVVASDTQVTAAFQSTDPLELEDNVVQLTDEQRQGLISYNAESGTLLLAEGTATSNIEPGTVLVPAADPHALVDTAFLLRVTGVTAVEDGPTRVLGTPATLDDVVKTGTIEISQPLNPDPTASDGADQTADYALGPPPATTCLANAAFLQKGFSHAWSDGSATNGTICANGAINARLRYDGELQEIFLRTVVEAGVASNNQIASAKAGRRFAAASASLGKYPVGWGLFLEPELSVAFEPRVQPAGQFNYQLTHEQRMIVTLRYAKGRGFSFDETFENIEAEFKPLTGTAAGKHSAEVVIQPQVSFAPTVLTALNATFGMTLTGAMTSGAGIEPVQGVAGCEWNVSPYWAYEGKVNAQLELTSSLTYNPSHTIAKQLTRLAPITCSRRSDPGDPVLPAPPELAVHTPAEFGKLRLTWTLAPGAAYEVHRDGSYVATTVAAEFVDGALGDDEAHCYRLRAVLGNAEAWSNEACGRTRAGPQPPAPPTGLALAGPATAGAIPILWQAAADAGSETSYLVTYGPSDWRWTGVLQASGTRATLTGLQPDTEYCLYMQAVEGGLLSAETARICARTAAQGLGGDDYPNSRANAKELAFVDNAAGVSLGYMETAADVDWVAVQAPAVGTIDVEFRVLDLDRLDLGIYLDDSGLRAVGVDVVSGSVTRSVDVRPNQMMYASVAHLDATGNSANDRYALGFEFAPAPNSVPVADAGFDRTVYAGTDVVLAGGASMDPDGSIASYVWTQTSGPKVALRGANSASPSFAAPAVTEDTVLIFWLTVTDDQGAAASDDIQITVVPVADNQPPVADAGLDQTVVAGTSVSLSGIGSADADGVISAYAWAQTTGPAVVLTGADAATASFTAPAVDVETQATFRLTVTDDDGAADDDAVVVTLRPRAGTNQPPVADAGDDQTVTAGDVVLLFGAGSSDPDGTISGYAWTQTAGPTVTLSYADTAHANFTAPAVSQDTVLTFRLTVADDVGTTAADTVRIAVRPSAANRAPQANAGTDQVATSGDSVTLFGISSWDPDGAIASHRWIQTQGPAVTLSGAATATATFTAPAVSGETVLAFQLTVTDDDGATDTDTVRVTVEPPPPNQPPVADAGLDRTVFAGADVVLSAASSSDLDGRIVSYAWTQRSGPSVALSGAKTASASFAAPAVIQDTVLTFRLTVTDDDGASASDDVDITVVPAPVNKPPVADAGEDQTATSGDTVYLVGAESSDPDGLIASYAWTQTAGPNVVLHGADTMHASFTAPTVAADTVLTFRLTVADDDGASASDDVRVTVAPKPANRPPVADAGDDQTVTSGDSVSLYGAGSSDPDGVIAAYAWTQTSGPVVPLTGADTAHPNFTAPAVTQETQLAFRLTVTDDDDATATDSTVVYVRPGAANQAPTADAGTDQAVASGDSVTLFGISSWDPDGTITSYSWTQTRGPTVALSGAGTDTATFIAPTVTQETVLAFRLTVTDDDGASDTDTVRVTVEPAPANQPPVADAGFDQTVFSGDDVVLSAASSWDVDGWIASYAWTQRSGPSVTLTGAAAESASFTAPDVTQDTVLTFRVTVTDDNGASATDDVDVTVVPAPVNQGPVAHAGEDQTVTSGDTVYLSGVESSDPDGLIDSYAWTQTSGPTVTLDGADTMHPSFTAPTVTQDTALTFRLTVTDDDKATATDTVRVTVQPAAGS